MNTIQILIIALQIISSPVEGQNQQEGKHSPLISPSSSFTTYTMETGFPAVSKNIMVDLAYSSEIELYLLDSNQQTIRTLDKGLKSADSYCYTIDLRYLPRGDYYYRLVVNNKEIIKSLLKEKQ